MPSAPDFSAVLAPTRGPRAGRRVDAGGALAAIPDGSRVLIPSLSGVPMSLLEALDAERGRWSRLEIVGGICLEPIAPFAHAGAPFHFRTWQFSASYGPARAAGALSVLPARYADCATLFLPDGPCPADVVLVQVSPPGADGHFSLGTSVGGVIDAMRAAPLVIAQVNAAMPYTFGAGEVERTAFDFLVERDAPLIELRRAAPGPAEEAVAEHVAGLVPPGATLQFGIGAVPEAIMARLAGHVDLGVHSGLISDGIIDLVERGVVTNRLKAFDTDAMITAEIAGSRALYDWVHRNPRVRMAPARYTHGLPVLLRTSALTALNSAVEVSLDGTVNAESLGARLISGPGGQPDFAEGARGSVGGVSVVALPSTAAGGKASRIVRRLAPGSTVTVPRHLADRVVTEYGVASLRGRSLEERAEALRAIAAPAFREALAGEEQAG